MSPTDKAAKPETFTATVPPNAQNARIRADVFQLDDFGDTTILAATYFDLPVNTPLTAPRAFGITLNLR